MALEHGHSPGDIRARLRDERRASYLRDWIYGGIDGAVTTFAVVAGVAGAALPGSVVLILGFANLIADGFSMAAGNYSGTKAEEEEYARLVAVERRHIAAVPEGEREEIRQIFAAKGFAGEALETIVRTISANEKGWIDTMMTEEYGRAPVRRSPITAAASTFAAFCACGLVPLLPYLVGGGFAAAAAATLLTFFLIGSAKSRWTLAPWWRSGAETLLIGGVAAALAYAVGVLLSGLAG